MIRGTLLLTAGNGLLRLIGMGFQVWLSRTVGAEGMGLMQLILTVYGLAMILGCSGLRTAAMYLAAEEYGHRRLSGVRQAVDCCLRVALGLSMAVGCILFFAASPLSVHWIGSGAASAALQTAAIFLPFSCLCAVLGGYFTACGRLKVYVALEIGEKLVSVGITLALLEFWAAGDPERVSCAIMGGSGIGSLLDFLMLYLLYRREHLPRAVGQSAMGQRLVQLCVPLAANDYLRYGLHTAEQLLIPYGLVLYGLSRDEALAGYGILHGMAFPVLMFPAAILYSLADLMIPELARANAEGMRVRIRQLVSRCLDAGIWYAAATAGLFLVAGQWLGQLLYGSAEAGQVIRQYAPVVLILYTDAITDGLLKGLGQQLHNVRYNTLTSLLDVLGLFLLLPRLGMFGYQISFVLTHLLNLLLSMNRLRIVSGVWLHPKMIAAVMAPTGLCVVLSQLIVPSQRNSVLPTICYLSMVICWALLRKRRKNGCEMKKSRL